MLGEAEKRIVAAKVLSEAKGLDSLAGGEQDTGDSAHLLDLLALELLLKLLFSMDENRPPDRNHNYADLFDALSDATRQEVRRIAGQRIGPSSISTDSGLAKALKLWGNNFVSLRYPYERYSTMTEKQYTLHGEDWVKRGAPSAEADFEYRVLELKSIVRALVEVARRRLTESE
ncbi:MAG: hypothetical protein R3E83_19325 [Burkholderiaceae bacterium]